MKMLPGRFSETVPSRTVSPTALRNEGPPLTAPSFWLVTSTTIPLLSPSSSVGYHFSSTWSAYSNASALLYKIRKKLMISVTFIKPQEATQLGLSIGWLGLDSVSSGRFVFGLQCYESGNRIRIRNLILIGREIKIQLL